MKQNQIYFITPFRYFLGLLSMSLLFGCGGYYQGPKSDHFDGKRFFNPGKPMDKGFGSLLKWKLNGNPQAWPEYSDLKTYDQPPQRVYGSELRVSNVGHTTFLLQTHGVNILTDPVWVDRASPFQWIGPKRVHPPGIKFSDLPPIDVVLVSHNHYDHLDLATLKKLWQRDHPRIIVPLGNDTIITSYDSSIVVESFDWGDTTVLNESIKIYVEPMHHWSARGLFDRNKALWAAFILSSPDGDIYFVGDSGYGKGDYFKLAKEKFKTIRLALLPIGSYEPKWFMSYGHMDPEEAIQAYQNIESHYMIPIHYGVFQLTDTGYQQPVDELKGAMKKYEVPEERIKILQPGDYWNVPRISEHLN